LKRWDDREQDVVYFQKKRIFAAFGLCGAGGLLMGTGLAMIITAMSGSC